MENMEAISHNFDQQASVVQLVTQFACNCL